VKTFVCSIVALALFCFGMFAEAQDCANCARAARVYVQAAPPVPYTAYRSSCSGRARSANCSGVYAARSVGCSGSYAAVGCSGRVGVVARGVNRRTSRRLDRRADRSARVYARSSCGG